MEFARDFLNVNRRLGELHAERLECLRNDPRNGEITEPFIVRWDDEPGRVLRARLANGIFVGGNVIVPQFPLRIVVFTDLPVSGRVVETPTEAYELLLWADVQEELEDVRAVLEKALFEIIDQLITPLPDFLGNKLVYTHHEDVLVLRPIENDDLAFLRRLLLDAPEKVMLRLLFRGRFESMDARALWVHRAEDVIDGSVLPGG